MIRDLLYVAVEKAMFDEELLPSEVMNKYDISKDDFDKIFRQLKKERAFSFNKYEEKRNRLVKDNRRLKKNREGLKYSIRYLKDAQNHAYRENEKLQKKVLKMRDERELIHSHLKHLYEEREYVLQEIMLDELKNIETHIEENKYKYHALSRNLRPVLVDLLTQTLKDIIGLRLIELPQEFFNSDAEQIIEGSGWDMASGIEKSIYEYFIYKIPEFIDREIREIKIERSNKLIWKYVKVEGCDRQYIKIPLKHILSDSIGRTEGVNF